MNTKLKSLIAVVSLLALSVLFLGIVYDFKFTLANVSNSLFVVNIISFVVSFMIHTGALRLTLGVSYTTKTIFKRDEMRDKYDGFKEYYEEKAPNQARNLKYLLIINLVFIAAALVLAKVHLDNYTLQ